MPGKMKKQGVMMANPRVCMLVSRGKEFHIKKHVQNFNLVGPLFGCFPGFRGSDDFINTYYGLLNGKVLHRKIHVQSF